MPDIKPFSVRYEDPSSLSPTAKFARSMQSGAIKTGKNQIVSSLGYTSNVSVRKDYVANPVVQFTPYKPENSKPDGKSKDEKAEDGEGDKPQESKGKKSKGPKTEKAEEPKDESSEKAEGDEPKESKRKKSKPTKTEKSEEVKEPEDVSMPAKEQVTKSEVVAAIHLLPDSWRYLLNHLFAADFERRNAILARDAPSKSF